MKKEVEVSLQERIDEFERLALEKKKAIDEMRVTGEIQQNVASGRHKIDVPGQTGDVLALAERRAREAQEAMDAAKARKTKPEQGNTAAANDNAIPGQGNSAPANDNAIPPADADIPNDQAA